MISSNNAALVWCLLVSGLLPCVKLALKFVRYIVALQLSLLSAIMYMSE